MGCAVGHNWLIGLCQGGRERRLTVQARTDSTRGRCGGGRDDRAGGVAVGAIESGLEAADEGAGAGFREVVGGLVGGGNVGQADGAVVDHLLPEPPAPPAPSRCLLGSRGRAARRP